MDEIRLELRREVNYAFIDCSFFFLILAECGTHIMILIGGVHSTASCLVGRFVGGFLTVYGSYY